MAAPYTPDAAPSAGRSCAALGLWVAGEQTQRAAQVLPASHSRAAREEPPARSVVLLPAVQLPLAVALTAVRPVEVPPALRVHWVFSASSRTRAELAAE